MTENEQTFELPKQNSHVLKALRTRRSNLAKFMTGEGPDEDTLRDILSIAARVPDHRKLTPWRFIKFEGQARSDFGHHIGAAFQKESPDMPLDRVVFEAARLKRAPLVIAVISSPKDCPRGTPKWEQVLSSGAVCFNLIMAAQAHGFAAQWLTEWYAYNDDVLEGLGLEEKERVAGFIYIGKTQTAPLARTRPDLSSLLSEWKNFD